MARTTSKTHSYHVQSPVSGTSRILIERTYVKSTPVAGGYIRARKEYALFDTDGRKYNRIAESIVECAATGERFHVLGQADHIRKSQ